MGSGRGSGGAKPADRKRFSEFEIPGGRLSFIVYYEFIVLF